MRIFTFQLGDIRGGATWIAMIHFSGNYSFIELSNLGTRRYFGPRNCEAHVIMKDSVSGRFVL